MMIDASLPRKREARQVCREDSLRTLDVYSALCKLKFNRRQPGGLEVPMWLTLWRNVMANQVVWVDIPVVDLDRAVRFYSAVLGSEVKKQEYPGMTIGLLPGAEKEVSGCLFTKDDEKPSATGLLIYLNAQGRLDQAVAAVEANGGKVILPKQPIGPHGFRAVVLDSEGNRIALHSM
jgi:uncharacterized protein